jgi:hypothetical protein
MIHPLHLTLYAIIAASTCGGSLVFLIFVSLYSIARVLVDLMRQARERAKGGGICKPKKLIASQRRQRQWSFPGRCGAARSLISPSGNRAARPDYPQ